jgi:hypothetical protein
MTPEQPADSCTVQLRLPAAAADRLREKAQLAGLSLENLS